jgi:hypothetical protein
MLDFVPYLVRSALRNKVRTVLTLFGVMVAVGVFSLLASLESSMHRSIDRTAQSALLVVNEKDKW